MIWKGLVYNKRVKVLDFSENYIGDEGLDCIGQTLQCNTTLEKIKLSSCFFYIGGGTKGINWPKRQQECEIITYIKKLS